MVEVTLRTETEDVPCESARGEEVHRAVVRSLALDITQYKVEVRQQCSGSQKG